MPLTKGNVPIFQYSYNRKHYHICKFKNCLNINSNLRIELSITYLIQIFIWNTPSQSARTCLFPVRSINFIFNGTVMQIEKALINDQLLVSKVS